MKCIFEFTIAYQILTITGTFAQFYGGESGGNSVRVLESENVQNPDGSYYYKYNLDNGIMEMVEGRLKNVNNAQVYTVIGSYEHPTDTGSVWVVDYIADETGYHAMVSLRRSGGTLGQGRSYQPLPPPPAKIEVPERMATIIRNEMAKFLHEFHKRYFRRKYIIF